MKTRTLLTSSITGFLTLISQLSWAQDAAPGVPAGAAPQPPSLLMQLPMFVGIFLLMYVLILRPQRQQQKKQQALVANLQKGEEVVLASGFLGRIVGLTERIATVEISDGVEIRVLRSQVQGYSKEIVGQN